MQIYPSFVIARSVATWQSLLITIKTRLPRRYAPRNDESEGNYPSANGFTLIEIMIVIAIIGILASVAYPSYTKHVMHARRSDAQVALLNLAASMESYYTENHSYANATPQTLGLSDTSPQGYYQLSIVTPGPTSYTLTATPIAGSPQANDTTCPTLTLDNTNAKGPSNDCWQ